MGRTFLVSHKCKLHLESGLLLLNEFRRFHFPKCDQPHKMFRPGFNLLRCITQITVLAVSTTIILIVLHRLDTYMTQILIPPHTIRDIRNMMKTITQKQVGTFSFMSLY